MIVIANKEAHLQIGNYTVTINYRIIIDYIYVIDYI